MFAVVLNNCVLFNTEIQFITFWHWTKMLTVIAWLKEVDALICWEDFPYVSMCRFYCLLDSLVVECWLWVQDVPGSIPSQGPRHTKDIIKMVPVVHLFSTQHWKGKYWLKINQHVNTLVETIYTLQYKGCKEMYDNVRQLFLIVTK